MTLQLCVTYRQQLVRLWTKRWSSMENHQMSASEIHRKVLRMVSSMSELDARSMLREMNGSSEKNKMFNFDNQDLIKR